MFSEKNFEDIICKYPELIERGLIFKGRQISIYGKRIDILFEDKFGQKLIIELKIGPIDREHIGQVMEYEGEVLSEEEPTARIMLVGNRVPPNLQRALSHHGIEWKEVSLAQLRDFLETKNDKEFCSLVGEEDNGLKQLLIKKEKILSKKHQNNNLTDVLSVERDKMGILFCIKGTQHAKDGAEHLKNHEELYFSIGYGIKAENFYYPLTALIHVSGDKVRYKCRIKNIKPYEKLDHSDLEKKPQKWVDDYMREPKPYKTTIIIDSITAFDYETRELMDLSSNKIKNPPTGYQRIILP